MSLEELKGPGPRKRHQAPRMPWTLAEKRRGGSGQTQSGPLRPGCQASKPLSALFARDPSGGGGGGGAERVGRDPRVTPDARDDDDHPFIVLTETKFSFRCIPVWMVLSSAHHRGDPPCPPPRTHPPTHTPPEHPATKQW